MTTNPGFEVREFTPAPGETKSYSIGVVCTVSVCGGAQKGTIVSFCDPSQATFPNQYGFDVGLFSVWPGFTNDRIWITWPSDVDSNENLCLAFWSKDVGRLVPTDVQDEEVTFFASVASDTLAAGASSTVDINSIHVNWAGVGVVTPEQIYTSRSKTFRGHVTGSWPTTIGTFDVLLYGDATGEDLRIMRKLRGSTVDTLRQAVDLSGFEVPPVRWAIQVVNNHGTETLTYDMLLGTVP